MPMIAPARGEEHQFDCRMIAKDGKAVPVQVHISVLMQADQAIELRGFMFLVENTGETPS